MQVITSGCATFPPWASAVGGIVGGLITLPGSLFVLHILKVDDPVDAFVVSFPAVVPVHAIVLLSSCGISWPVVPPTWSCWMLQQCCPLLMGRRTLTTHAMVLVQDASVVTAC